MTRKIVALCGADQQLFNPRDEIPYVGFSNVRHFRRDRRRRSVFCEEDDRLSAVVAADESQVEGFHSLLALLQAGNNDVVFDGVHESCCLVLIAGLDYLVALMRETQGESSPHRHVGHGYDYLRHILDFHLVETGGDISMNRERGQSGKRLFDFRARFLYIVRTPAQAGFKLPMTRSLKKGPYVDEKLMKKVTTRTPGAGGIKTWARASMIAPEFVNFTFLVHTGNKFEEVFVTEDMVGHRLGEFAPTTRFIRHGGKMQKEAEQAAKQAEIAAAQAAKNTAAKKK